MLVKLIKNPLFWIFFLALFLRLYRLGEFPVGFHVDEVKAGWNAYSILKTGRDDHGNLFPLYYDSIGDYRPTGIFYFTIPSVALFGNSEFAVRFPSSLFGALTVFPIYLLTNALLKKGKITFNGLNYGHLSSFLLSISPWHIETSRATSEVVISAFFAIFSIHFLIIFVQSGKFKDMFLSLGTLAVGYLLYHSVRILMPLFFLAIVFYYTYYTKDIRKKTIKKYAFAAFGFALLIGILFGTAKESRQRLMQVSILNNVDIAYEVQRVALESAGHAGNMSFFDSKNFIYAKHILNEYLSYFNTDFLVGDGAKPYRYTTPGVGLLAYFELLLLVAGVLQIIRGKFNLLPLILLVIAPLVSTVTTEDVPNLHRAFYMLPFMLIIESYGLGPVFNIFKRYGSRTTLAVFFILTINILYFWHMYFQHSFTHRPFINSLHMDAPSYRNMGAKELAMRVDDLSGKYGKVILTSFPDSALYWYEYFTKKDPAEFNQLNKGLKDDRANYKNILFSSIKCLSTDKPANKIPIGTLLVESSVCDYQNKIDTGQIDARVTEKIYGPDGAEIYAFLEIK